jgi:coenzyme F420-0:L-glutamate ligase
MLVSSIKTRLFVEGEDLAAFIGEHSKTIKNGSIIAICSKIVALSEGRVALAHTREEKEALIAKESEWRRQVMTRWWLTVRDGTVVVNGGIDESNAEGKLILLPEDSFKTAEQLRMQLMKKHSLSELGVIITDSRIMPLRAGVVGVAIGYAGFRGIKDYRGTTDLYGRPMEVTQTDIADSLATAVTVVCGEGNECQPLAIIEDAPVEWTDEMNRKELHIPQDQDMFRSLFE